MTDNVECFGIDFTVVKQDSVSPELPLDAGRATTTGLPGAMADTAPDRWGRNLIRSCPWMVTFPGLFIMFTVLALNLFGDGLRDALDPKLKK